MSSQEKPAKESKPFRLQEQVEWIAVAFILALTVRCFVVEAYQIPTGSMAPTLYGSHLNVTCPSCNTTFVVGQRDNENYGGDFVCPACGRTGARPRRRCPSAGATGYSSPKNLYLFAKPRRWDVFVFKNPQAGKQEQNFVKRLVGLPGERFELRDGQVFVNGVIVVEARSRAEGALAARLRLSCDEKLGGVNWSCGPDWAAAPEGLLLEGEPRRAGRPSSTPGASMISTRTTPAKAATWSATSTSPGTRGWTGPTGSFAAAVWADNRTFRAVFTPAAAGLKVELRINEQSVGEKLIALPAARDFDFALYSVDGRTTVKVGGEKVVEYVEEMRAEDTPLYTRANGVFFQGMGSRMLVSNVDIKRDVYYGMSILRPDSVAISSVRARHTRARVHRPRRQQPALQRQPRCGATCPRKTSSAGRSSSSGRRPASGRYSDGGMR